MPSFMQRLAGTLPGVYERAALPLHPYRLRLAAASATTFLLLFGAGFWAYCHHLTFSANASPYIKTACGISFFIITASWDLFLTSVWFHPIVGSLRSRPTSRASIRALTIAALRLWASIVLTVGFVIAFAPLLWLW